MRKVAIPNEELMPEIIQLLSEGICVTMKVKGNSMLPFIVGGRDSVILQKSQTLHVGDIVLAEIAPACFVLHRILKIEGDHITLMGDGNLWGTEECSKEHVHGYVVTVIRKGKQIDCNSNKERRKAHVWRKLLPVRRYLLGIYRRIII